jgi:hypothetical protein
MVERGLLAFGLPQTAAHVVDHLLWRPLDEAGTAQLLTQPAHLPLDLGALAQQPVVVGAGGTDERSFIVE